jgi:plasmid stabilization system protein ParE
MNVQWSGPAERAVELFLDWLEERNPSSRRRAQTEIRAAGSRLGRHPLIGRQARWQGLRELSLTRWKKILVYRVGAEDVTIVALYDARQDLRRVDPER